MSKLLDSDKSKRKQYLSLTSGNVVLITSPKAPRSQQQISNKTLQASILPFSQKQIQPQIDNSHAGLRMLLVEGNAGERQACRTALQQVSDWTVELIDAPSGEVGLYLASREVFDCIVLDSLLPDMTDTEFLERLSELVGARQLPVLKLVDPGKFSSDVAFNRCVNRDCLVKDNDGFYLKMLPATIQRMLKYRRTEHEKYQVEALYHSLVEHIPAITYLASARNGNPLLYISPQLEQLGYSRDLWLSRPDVRFQCIYEDDRSEVKQRLAQCQDSGEVFRCEYRMRSRNGKLHWFLDEARVIKDQNGQAMFLQGIMLDITDKKFMESELASHRYFLEQRVQDRTEQLEKRIAILESCNHELCDQLERKHCLCNELREINTRQTAMIQALRGAEAAFDAGIC